MDKPKRRRRTKAEMELLREKAIDYRRAGKSQNWIADELGVSYATAHQWIQGVEKDMEELITTQVAVKKKLLDFSDNQRQLFESEVDKRMRYVEFFNDLAVKNAKAAADKITDETTQVEHRLLAETILKSRETVLGKTPDTAIQINNTTGGASPFATPEEFVKAGQALLDAI